MTDLQQKKTANRVESFHTLEPPNKPRRGHVHGETFERKRQKPEEPRRGHLENLPLLEHRERVVPFRQPPNSFQNSHSQPQIQPERKNP